MSRCRVQAEYIVGKLEEAVQSLDQSSATLDMVVQGVLSIDDAARQANLGDVKPLNVDMDVFARESVVRCRLSTHNSVLGSEYIDAC